MAQLRLIWLVLLLLGDVNFSKSLSQLADKLVHDTSIKARNKIIFNQSLVKIDEFNWVAVSRESKKAASEASQSEEGFSGGSCLRVVSAPDKAIVRVV